MKIDLGKFKIWGDVLQWYWSKFQFCVIIFGGFKYLGLSWHLSILLFFLICVLSAILVWLHITYVLPKALKYQAMKNPVTIEMLKLLKREK